MTASDGLVERVARALADDLLEHCVQFGKCYAVADREPAYDGDMGAEVDGEFSLLSLARAAVAEMIRSDIPLEEFIRHECVRLGIILPPHSLPPEHSTTRTASTKEGL